MQVSDFPLLLVFLFLSIQISTLLFQGDGIMQWMKGSRSKKTPWTANIPFVQPYFPVQESHRDCLLALIFFILCNLSFNYKTGKKKKSEDNYFILHLLNGCLASNNSFCIGRYLAMSVIFIQADIERLLLLPHVTVLTGAKLWSHLSVQYAPMQTHLSSWKFFLPHLLP